MTYLNTYFNKENAHFNRNNEDTLYICLSIIITIDNILIKKKKNTGSEYSENNTNFIHISILHTHK